MSERGIMHEVHELAQKWLKELHDAGYERIEEFEDRRPTGSILETKVWELFSHNYTIWHHEDYCRTNDEAAIVTNKRRIDVHNQKRNDCIERLDLEFVAMQKPSETFNSETLGSIIDRLIINELKLYHSVELNVVERVQRLERQTAFLVDVGNQLFDDMLTGVRNIAPFSQLKMYNTPGLNPKMTP